MIEDELLIEGLRRAADAAGTVGATARMVSDELSMDHLDVLAGLARLERAGALEADVAPNASRWYSEPDTEEERAVADAEWRRETDELLDVMD